jgi:hypothetical protein
MQGFMWMIQQQPDYTAANLHAGSFQRRTEYPSAVGLDAHQHGIDRD